MSKIAALMVVLGACLMLAACQPKPSSSASDEASALEDQIERKIAFIEDLLVRRDDATRLIDALMAPLPERVWLTEVEYGGGEARVKGIARSNILFIDYLSSLERSDALEEVALRSSERRKARDRETQEFELRAVLAGPHGDVPRAPGSAETRLEELEKLLPPSDETAESFRQFQRLASDAGLQMMKFAPGNGVRAEFYDRWPVSIEVMGDPSGIPRFFRAMTALPHLWGVQKFSLKTLSADDSRSPVRAVIEVEAFLLDR